MTWSERWKIELGFPYSFALPLRITTSHYHTFFTLLPFPSLALASSRSFPRFESPCTGAIIALWAHSRGTGIEIDPVEVDRGEGRGELREIKS